MILKYNLLLLVLIIISCKRDNKKLASIITSTNCYWDVHDNYSAANKRVAYCWKFNQDGSCFFLYTPNKRGKRHEYDADDLVVPKTWELKGDTILYLQGTKRRVINFSNDTLLLENPFNKEKDTLIRNCK